MTSDLEKSLGVVRSDRFKSQGERRLAGLLDSYDIRYRYEQGVLVEDKEKPKIWHPDFYLPEFSVYIEYFGLAGNQDYDLGIKRKKHIYSEMGLDVIPVYPWTFYDDWQGYVMGSLRGILDRRLDTFFGKQYQTPQQGLHNRNSSRMGTRGYARPRGSHYR